MKTGTLRSSLVALSLSLRGIVLSICLNSRIILHRALEVLRTLKAGEANAFMGSCINHVDPVLKVHLSSDAECLTEYMESLECDRK